jgi:hypothetical protein
LRPSRLYVNVANLRGLSGQRIVIDVNPDDAAPVPEPTTVALFSAGLLLSLRRRVSRP